MTQAIMTAAATPATGPRCGHMACQRIPSLLQRNDPPDLHSPWATATKELCHEARDRHLRRMASGFRQFLLRGVEKVRAEWAIICTTHNLLKLFTLANAA